MKNFIFSNEDEYTLNVVTVILHTVSLTIQSFHCTEENLFNIKGLFLSCFVILRTVYV